MGRIYMSESLERLVKAEERRRDSIRWAGLNFEQRAAESRVSADIQTVFRGKGPFKVRLTESSRAVSTSTTEDSRG